MRKKAERNYGPRPADGYTAPAEPSPGDQMKPKRPDWQIALEIESRQDEVIRQLDELNDRLVQALNDLGVPVAGEECGGLQLDNRRLTKAA